MTMTKLGHSHPRAPEESRTPSFLLTASERCSAGAFRLCVPPSTDLWTLGLSGPKEDRTHSQGASPTSDFKPWLMLGCGLKRPH